MKRILERHDDVGTMGIVLYINPSLQGDNYEGSRIFKDAECKEGLTVEELQKIKYHPLLVEDVDEGMVLRVLAVAKDSILVNGYDVRPYWCIDGEVLA